MSVCEQIQTELHGGFDQAEDVVRSEAEATCEVVHNAARAEAQAMREALDAKAEPIRPVVAWVRDMCSLIYIISITHGGSR